MAGRIKYYTLFRKIHVYAAFTIVGFLFMYFITGFLMVHYEFFEDHEPAVTTANHTLRIPGHLTLKEIPEYLQEQLDIRGQRKNARVNEDGTISVMYIRPGHTYQAFITADRNNVNVTQTEEGVQQTITMFHRMEKYGGGMVYDMYILMMDLSGIALIIFSLTGFYLFLKTIRNKTTGYVLLSLSIAYTLFVIYSLLKI